ncbi:MAG: hypothetical protein LBL87_02860 [Ruminococcus sp.]|jgi:hypothetical protein|nr:hypothetical protein [Ruminococcus sp.]
MLKWQKQNAEALVETLIEAHGALAALIAVPEGAEASVMLKGGCRDCVKALCEIDDIFTETADEYRRFVDSAKAPEDALSLNIYADIFKSLIDKAKIKLEFVFFTYKLSMFDSFETLVRACNDDPDIEAFVVPIPYFDKTTSGTFGKMYFEEMKGLPQYADLNIVDFSHFSAAELARRRPDAIFINNPYDEGNLITTVHPDYYSNALRPFTDLLVYIPYFIMSEQKYDPLSMIPPHFAETYACAYADRIIVQSQNAALSYIKSFNEVGKTAAWIFSYGPPEAKFLPLGSPKIEKVITDKPENYILPDDWKKKIYRADGSKKTVIFLNSGLSGMLYGTSDHTKQVQVPTYFEKLESILKEFDNRPDFVLIWRPHPFMERTVKTNRSEVYGLYKKIVDDFIKKDNGIMDLTEDFHPAFSLADAYIGDGSSLLALFSLTGKPALYTNTYANEKRNLIDSHIFADGKIYFTVSGYPCLFESDLSGKTAVAATLPITSDCSLLRFSGIAKNGAKLYIAPASASEIIVYDTLSKTTEILEYDKSKNENGDPVYSIANKFISVFSDGEEVIFVGGGYPAIIKYNTVTSEKSYIDSYTNKMNPLAAAYTPIFKPGIITACAYENGTIYAVSGGLNGIAAINLQNGETEIIKTEDSSGFSAIAVNGNIAAAASGIYGSPLVLFDLKSKEITAKIPFPKGFESAFAEEGLPYDRISKIVYYDGSFWIFPEVANKVLKLTGNEFETVIDYPYGCRDGNNYLSAEANGDKLLFSTYNKKPAIISADGEKITPDTYLSKQKTVVGKIPISVYTYFSYTYELWDFSLGDFLDSLSDGIYSEKTFSDEYTKSQAILGKDTSKRILDYCKDYLKQGE